MNKQKHLLYCKKSPEFNKTKWLRYLSVFAHRVRLLVTLSCTEGKEKTNNFFILSFITFSKKEQDTEEFKPDNVLETT